MFGYLPCNQGLKSSMNVPSFRVESLPWEEIRMLSSYLPMGALAGLRMEMARTLSLLDRSCALQPLLLVSLESGNTAFVLADSEAEGPVKKTEDNGSQVVLARGWGDIRFQHNCRGPLGGILQGSIVLRS